MLRLGSLWLSWGGKPLDLRTVLGCQPHGGNGGDGRNVAMHTHRLRADDIVSSVIVMQGGTVFDAAVAERVRKHGQPLFLFVWRL